jgi:hydroxymethylbilane synthase
VKNVFRIGTRGSPLALWQAESVTTAVRCFFPELSPEIVKIKTGGDVPGRTGGGPLETKRIFTREIEEALLAGEVDAAVHSAKDLAAGLPDGLEIAAVTEREDPRDCLVSALGLPLTALPRGAVIGTGSLRRKMQLLRRNAGLRIEEMHGNVETRLRKMREGRCDAVVLALAGLRRLGLEVQVSEIFGEDVFYPAPGQGIVAVQSRAGDTRTREILKKIEHRETRVRYECERAFLVRLEGGCRVPCGITTNLRGQRLAAAGGVFALDELRWAEDKIEGDAADAAAIGVTLAEKILAAGGQSILEKIRKANP